MKLVFDENLPQSVAHALATVGLPVSHVLSEGVLRGTPDSELFAIAHDREWVLVTRDRNMWRKKGERAALSQAGVGILVIVSSSAQTPQQLLALLSRRLPEMLQAVERSPRPFVLRVPDKGKIGPF